MHAAVLPYGELIEPASLRLERLLPAPPGKVWAYLTDSELRRQWLASGDMVLEPGAPFEFVWRNDELTDPPGRRPAGFEAQHIMKNRIIKADAPRELVISWGENGEVSFVLTPEGQNTRLVLIHKRAPSPDILLNVSAGWHAHLDVRMAQLGGTKAKPHWDNWLALKQDYKARFGV